MGNLSVMSTPRRRLTATLIALKAADPSVDRQDLYCLHCLDKNPMTKNSVLAGMMRAFIVAGVFEMYCAICGRLMHNQGDSDHPRCQARGFPDGLPEEERLRFRPSEPPR